MASSGESAKRILTQPGHEPLQQMLEQLVVSNEGDQEAVVFGTSTATASLNTTGTLSLALPKDQTETEWIIQQIIVLDVAAIDSADRVAMVFVDDIIAQGYPFFSMKASALSGISGGNQWTWPQSINPPAPAVQDICSDYVPFRLFLRVNGESWRRIRIDISTTATAGTRSLKGLAIYRRRPTTRI
jgi:hypothetical protein